MLLRRGVNGILRQPGLSWHASNKVIVVIHQYGPTFATALGGIQYDCGGVFLTLPNIYLFSFIYN
jgi:hypothetical protein